MCGIVGAWTPQNKINKDILLKMRDSLSHRGPDDSGFYIDEKNNLGLGHRRLSVIDLSEKAHQPMLSENGNLIMVYNGEVYNFQEVKKELEKKGYKFRSNSDSEVVLKSFQEWGIDCLKRFQGMFAFAIWDNEKRELYLFRDRFGVKPLYYYFNKKELLFSSEIKSFYSYPQFKKEIDFKALSLYFKFGYIPAPLTIFKNTYKLEEGTILKIDSKFNFQKIRYWEPEKYFQEEKIIKSEEEIVNELEGILTKSFKYRMVADVDVGVFLSGGIDSSLITALLQKNSSQKLKTFTIGFKEKEYDEAPFARKVSEILGTEHNELYLSSKEIKNGLQDYIGIFDEPFGDSSSLPTYLLAKFAKEKIKVALSGDGGDELFLGYDKYKAVDKVMRLSSLAKLGSRIFLETLGPQNIKNIYSFLSRLLPLPQYSNLREKTSKLINLLREKELSHLFQSAGSYWQEKEIENLFQNKSILNNNIDRFYPDNNLGRLDQMQVWDIKNYLVDDVLVKTDRSTMAAGLEAREPFLDQSILKYIARVPIELKYKGGESKYLLKKILFKYLPKEIFQRPKAGFNIPVYDWLKNDWEDIVEEYLRPEKIKKEGIFQSGFIEEIVTKQRNGKYVNPDKLWLLINFQIWHQKWLRKF